MNFKTRFAPSPTGLLHLGHLASIMAVENVAKKLRAEMTLRIEDNDFTRCKTAYTEAIIETLNLFGFVFAGKVAYQSQNFARYRQWLDDLTTQDLVYPCFRNRSELPKYVRREATPRRGRANQPQDDTPPAWRLDIVAAVDKIKRVSGDPFWVEIAWTEDLAEETKHIIKQRQIPSDPILWRRDGVPAYLLCSTVDDITEGITHIVRGEDTRHLTLAQSVLMYLWKDRDLSSQHRPRYIFHPLITDEVGEKLAKRKGSKSLVDFLNEGISIESLRNMAYSQFKGQ